MTSLDDIVFEVDEQGIYRNIWTGNESLLAQPKDKLIGQRIRDALPEAVAARLEESIRRALNNNKVEEVEYPLDLPSGRHWFLARVSPIYSPDGSGKSVSILVRDITERKQAEEALKQVEYKYRNIFENATEAITQTTPDGKYLTANPATARILGYESAEELIASVSDLDHQFYVKPRRREEFLGLLEEYGVVQDFESEVYRKDGKKIWISESSRAIKAENGTTLYYEGTGTDITERKQAEQALHESEQRFRTFIEQSVDGAVLIDEQEKIIEWNPAQEKITGIPKVQAIGSSFAEIQYKLLPPSRRAQTSIKYFKDAMQNAFHSGESPEFVKPVAVEIRTPTGEQKFLMQTAFPIKTERGFRIGSVIHDVTETIQAEKIIRQRLAELELVYQSGLELGQFLEPEEIAQKIIDQMEKNLNWHHSAVRLYDPESQTLKVIGFNVPGLENEIDREGLEGHFNSLIQKLGDGLSGLAVQRDQTLRIGDLKRDPHYVETFPGLNSGLYVPIKTDNRIIGVISVENELPNAFSESDERLVGTLANQAAVALENSRLHNETQQQLNRLRALHSIDLAITNSLDLNVTLDVLLNQVIQQLHVDAAVIFLKEANINDLKYVMSRGFPYPSP